MSNSVGNQFVFNKQQQQQQLNVDIPIIMRSAANNNNLLDSYSVLLLRITLHRKVIKVIHL